MKYLCFVLIIFLNQIILGGDMNQVAKIKKAFTSLNANNIHILDDFYDEKVHFLDPLGSHKGLASVKSYYKKLYKNVTSIHFEYTNTISEGNKHLLVWTMKLKAKGLNSGKEIKLEGNSVILFNEKNLVIYHRDYFDMGEFIYEHIPILKWVISKIKSQLKR